MLVYSKYFPFQSSNFSVQKKAYKLLGAMLSADSGGHATFISGHLSELKELLLGSLSTAGAASKKVCQKIHTYIHVRVLILKLTSN